MCFEPGDRPPAPPTGSEAPPPSIGELRAADGATFAIALSRASGEEAPGVVILPDVRGLHGYYVDLASRFAGVGVHALALDPYGRTAGAALRDEWFDHTSHREAARDATLSLDVDAASGHLREIGASAVVTVGFCFGGRAALMQASRWTADGTIAFYGWPAREEEGGSSPIAEAIAGRVRVPILAMFGEEDRKITRDDIARYREALLAHGVQHDIVVYARAPHSFFDRKAMEHPEDCSDAWRRMLAFLDRIGHRPEDA